MGCHSAEAISTAGGLTERANLEKTKLPPVTVVTDPVVLSKAVDGVVLVVRASVTTKDALSRAKKQLADVGGKILGGVLNQFDEGGGKYYYHGYYGSQYPEDGDEPGRADLG